MSSEKYSTQRHRLIHHIKRSLSVPDMTAQKIALHFERFRLTKNDFLLKAGHVCDEYLFLENGLIRAYTYNSKGMEVTTNFYGQDSIAMDIASYITRNPSKENLQAITDCVGWKSHYHIFQTLTQHIPELHDLYKATLTNELIDMKEHARKMANLTAEEKYEYLLNSKQEIIRNASIKHISSYLGITDTSLSRIRRLISKK